MGVSPYALGSHRVRAGGLPFRGRLRVPRPMPSLVSHPDGEQLSRLEAVTNLVLVDAEEQAHAPPIERVTGARAPRGALVGEMLEFRAAGDLAGERACCLELGARLLEEEVDFGEALRMFSRALELGDERPLRRELASQLLRVGRYLEAADTLQGGELPPGSEEALDSLLRAGAWYSLVGEPRAAEAVLLHAASLSPADPRPHEQLASLGDWAQQALPPERCAELWLEAARRHPPDSDPALTDLGRAFDAAPHWGPAASAYADALFVLGRPDAADEVLRAYAGHAAERSAVALADTTRRRIESACALGGQAVALGAAFDACFWAPAERSDRNTPLLRLLKRQEMNAYLGEESRSRRRIRVALAEAAHTRTRMGRATALCKIARRMPPDARAVLLAVAAESYGAAGNLRRAREAASEAWQVAPWSARVLSTLVAVSADEELDAKTLEQAIALLPARAMLQRLLAERLDAEGALELSISWTLRWLDHSAGSTAACRALLERAARSGRAALLSAAVGRTLGASRPLGAVSDALAAALAAAAEIDPQSALGLARQLLDWIGPGDARLGESLAELAVKLGDRELELSIAVRRASGQGLPASDCARLFLRASELCLQAGKIPAAAAHLCQAAAHAADVGALGELDRAIGDALSSVPEAQRSDGMLARAHARAWAAEQQDTRSAVAAWRRLGALRWDLAGDRIGAEEAFFVACSQEPDRGPYRYAQDLCDRAGAGLAVEMVLSRAESLPLPDQVRLKARLLTGAARMAGENGLPEVALQAAVQAVQLDPARSDAVALVEKLAQGERGIEALHAVYDTLASTALGRFGERAAHYRAARQLEERGAFADALRHAIAAFEAVPRPGASYSMLLRLSRRCGDDVAAVRSVASVAVSGATESRIAWLRRASEIALRAPNGPELRFDLAINAFAVDPGAETVELLGEATADVLRHAPADEVVPVRFERAVLSTLKRLKGPRGAYTAIALAGLAARALGDGRLGCLALKQALDADPNGGGYEPMTPHLDVLASADEAALGLVAAIDARRKDKWSVLDPSLTQLFEALSSKLGYEPTDAAPAAKVPEPRPSAPETLPAEELMRRAAAESDEATPAATSEPPALSPFAAEMPLGPAIEIDAEGEARARGDYQALADLLATRAAATLDVEKRRLVRLRRVAVLEQRLERFDDAASELRAILGEVGEDPTSLRYLADLHDRQGRSAEAAELWLRASRCARAGEGRIPDLLRACEALLAAGDLAGVRSVLDAAGDLPASRELLRIRAELAQRVDDPHALVEALSTLRSLDPEQSDPEIALDVQAITTPPEAAWDEARTSEREPAVQPAAVADAPPPEAVAEAPAAPAAEMDDEDRVTNVAVSSSSALLEAARLDYRLRGAGTPEEARRTVEKLRPVSADLAPAHRDLRAFLMGEALDAAEGEGAADEWLRTHAELAGQTPLVAVALAEHHLRRKELEAALRLFAVALAGRHELHGVRSRGKVAIDAADAAHELGHDALGRPWLEAATEDDETVAAARERLARWFPAQAAPPTDAGAEAEPRRTSTTAATLEQMDDAQLPARRRSLPIPPPAPGNAAGELAPEERAAEPQRKGRRKRSALRASGTLLSSGVEPRPAPAAEPEPTPPVAAPEPAPVPPVAAPEPEPTLPVAAPEPAPAPPVAAREPEPAPEPALEATAGPETQRLGTTGEPSAPAESEPAALPNDGSRTDEHYSSRPVLSGPRIQDLFDDLVRGSYQAGEYLVALYEAGALKGHTAELLLVRRHQAAIRRGDPTTLTRLEEAARADRNEPYAKAIAHVRHAFRDRARAEPPPALEELAAHPELTTKLLFAGPPAGASEALAFVLQSGILRREMTDYGLSGVHRVPLGAANALGRTLAALARLVELPGVRLFHRSHAGPLQGSVALLSPLGAVIDGDASDDSPTLRYVVGSALAGTLPPCALAEGATEAETRDVLAALKAGFGPPGAAADITAEQRRLAEDLWHVVSAATERRLRELCQDPADLDLDRARLRARQACRRAGLFACGDLGTAVRMTVEELGLRVRTPLEDPAGLGELCSQPAISDLVDLATSPEYAEARWHRQPQAIASRPPATRPSSSRPPRSR